MRVKKKIECKMQCGWGLSQNNPFFKPRLLVITRMM
jgi:hypothetical protein